MSQVTNFFMDSCPAEVVALILENVPDMDTLWAFIRASPYVYSIYRTRRVHILPIAIYRDVGHIVIPEAFAALDSHSLRVTEEVLNELVEDIKRSISMDWIAPEFLPRSDALRWLEKYLPESERERWKKHYAKGNRTSKWAPLDEMLLWELHEDVKFMADLYVQETLPRFNKFAGKGRDLGSEVQPLTVLSFVERGGLFRCIYRFVISGNLFAPSSAKFDSWKGHEITERFLVNFTAWEVEKISCFIDFIHDKIEEKWQEMEDDEYNFLAADPERWKPDDTSHLWNSPPNDPGYFFSEDFKQEFAKEFRAGYAALPIKELRAVFQAKDRLVGQLFITWGQNLVMEESPMPFLVEYLDCDAGCYPLVLGSNLVRADADEDGLGWSFQKFDENQW